MQLGDGEFAAVRAGMTVWLESLFPRRRLLREIRAGWAKPGEKDAWLADRYFDLTRSGDDLLHVDEQTWNDLEFPRIFAQLDTTITRIGSQCLFRQMRTYAREPAQAQALYETFQALRRDRDLRERIQLTLMSLNADSAARVVETLYEPRIEGPKHPALIIGWSVVSLGLVGAMSASLIPLGMALLVLGVNVAISARTASRRYRLIETLRGIFELISVAEGLGRIRTDQPVAQIAALARARASRRQVKRVFRWFQRFGNLPMGLGIWLNLVFPAEVLVSIHTVNRLPGVREELRSMYEQVGSLDAAIAVASFLERAAHCPAASGPDSTIEIEAGYHPLIQQPVPNSLRLEERSALISGSNMAGKTTFIKMVAINLIFGRTLGFCLARDARIPWASVMACIRTEQSVESGKSRYFAEIETILTFLRRDGGDGHLVVVIDEPFSGTNTTERVAAAKAVLAALSRHSLVLATTHDVELQEMLRDRFDMFHFTENPQVEGYFDYRLQRGPCYERNALKLLAEVGYPHAVIAEAVELAGASGGPAKADLV